MRLVDLLVRNSPAGSELLAQAQTALVTEHLSDGWLLEFHHPTYGRMARSALKPVAEGYFGSAFESAEAEVVLFVDENGLLRDLEVFGYNNNAQKPFPSLDNLHVL